jgi:hypothetical protein
LTIIKQMKPECTACEHYRAEFMQQLDRANALHKTLESERAAIARFLVPYRSTLPESWLEQFESETTRLLAVERRLHDMMPLFTEARDALPAISTVSARMHGIDLSLASRMDTVGNYEMWKKMDDARQGATRPASACPESDSPCPESASDSAAPPPHTPPSPGQST